MGSMTSPEPTGRATRRPRRARNSLSRAEILDAAQLLIENEGLAQLSMPTLGRRLGCAAMSIYRYFANKNELLEALAEQVMRDLHRRLPPAGDGPWSEELVAYFTAYRDLIDDFPAYREVVLFAPAAALRVALTPAQLRRLDTGIGLLRRAGLSLEDATRVYNVCFNYTRSFAAFEHAVRPADAAAEAAPPERLPADEYPHLALLPDFTAALNLDETGFRLGLNLLTEGISRRYGVPTHRA
jgi:AcrR family transcriptional regulator